MSHAKPTRAVLPIDADAIHNLTLVVDRLAMLPYYEDIPREVVVQDLLSALLIYWIKADTDDLEDLIDEFKHAWPGFRDHETFDAISALANPGASGYTELQGCLDENMPVFEKIRWEKQIIIFDVHVDEVFRSIRFSAH